MAGQDTHNALIRKGLFKASQLLPATEELATRGTQILYVPQHADGYLSHIDVEAGFVTSTNVQFAFCRYWHNGVQALTKTAADLRTKLNSEATGYDSLYIIDTVPQRLVERALEAYCKEV